MARLFPVLLALCVGCTPSVPSVGDATRALAAWRPGAPIPDVPLVDARGRPFALRALQNDVVVVAFVFSRCAVPAACPRTLEVLRAARGAGRAHVRFLVVTLDPTFDTPAVLAAHQARSGLAFDDVTFATGAPGLVDVALPALWNVIALQRGATLDHVVKVALLDKGLVPVAEWGADDLSADAVRAQIEAALVRSGREREKELR
jgi:protein SCO1/2